jgi:hypothetical protein
MFWSGTLGRLFLSLALIVLLLFNAIGLGRIFLALFFPVIIAGFLEAFPVAVGFISPLAIMINSQESG